MSNFFIIENNTLFHSLFQRILKIKGHRVVGWADNYIEFLEKISNIKPKPDIVLINQRASSEEYVDISKELLNRYPNLRIIFMSTNGTAARQRIKSGAVMFVKKPFSIDSLYSSIERLSS